jgi:hypothetical protein
MLTAAQRIESWTRVETSLDTADTGTRAQLGHAIGTSNERDFSRIPCPAAHLFIELKKRGARLMRCYN